MPTIDPPPNWEKDALSQFLQLAYNNQLVTAGRKPAPFYRLTAIDGLFLRIAQHIINPRNPTATNLFYRAHSAFRAACATAMAGQVTETFVLTRSCLEYAAYALHIQENPGYDLVWWARNQSAKHKKAAITSFALGRLRETIEKHDKRLAAVFDELYERTIDFGAHPNQSGVASSLSIDEGPERVAIVQAYLHADGLQMDHALKTTAQVGICALRITQFMMPDKFMLLGVQDGIRHAENGL
jgi:hypothetical protein